MRSPTRPSAPVRPVAVIGLALLLAACGSVGTSAPASQATLSPVLQASETAATEPSITPVPGGQTVAPPPAASGIPTTQTEWGEILDALPESFPIRPGAEPADADEPASGAFSLPGTVDAAVTWYEDALTQLGFAVDVAGALEDGSRVLDAQGDLPECRIRMTFRPAADSAIITVLYAAGCAAAG